MSRWTKFRDRVHSVTVGVIKKPISDVRNTAYLIRNPRELAPSYVLKQDRATALDKLALGEGVSDLRAVRNTGRVVGLAIGAYFGGSAAYSAASGGATAGAVELGVAGTDVGVAAGASSGTGLVGTAAAGGGGLFSTTNLGTAALVLNALKKGNVAGAVDALTGTDWGSQVASFIGGGSGGGGGGSRMGPNDGPQQPDGGISPVFLVIGGLVLIVGFFFLFRKVFK